MQRHTITLEHPTDWEGFRTAARALVQANISPQTVDWRCQADAAEDLFAPEPHSHNALPPPAPDAPTLRVPPDFVHLCEQLIRHRDPGRFALMYRLLWRMAQGGHEADSARHDPLDADRRLAHHMVRSVRRDIHKMHAFVRFRPVVESDGQTLHMAWFEPDHHITEANAGFFIRRFTQMHWAILTPDACVRWDGKALHTSPGAQRVEAVHARQDDVKKHQLGRVLRNQGEPLLGIQRLAGFVAGRAQHLAQHSHHRGRVVNDQHPGALARVHSLALAPFHGPARLRSQRVGAFRRLAHTGQKPVEDAHGVASVFRSSWPQTVRVTPFQP